MRVAVVGGGIQGCAVALELAHRGIDVVLFERGARLFDGASRHSEGKLHLCFVYAADPTFRTPELMARGAAAFLPALRRWLGDGADDLRVSRAFNYAVHRDSLHAADDLEGRYHRIAAMLETAFAGSEYFDDL